jgi:RNA polymerase sigma factor (sigma-70 family)
MGELVNLVKDYQNRHDPVVGDRIVGVINPSLRIFLSLHSPKEWLDDILQETLIGIFLGIDRFKGSSDAQFYGYCYIIARRRVVDALRRRGREPKYVSPETEFWEAIAQPEPALSKRQLEQFENLMALLVAVRPPCALYLMAHYVVGLTHQQMRKEFGFPSAAAARMATTRCLRLAQKLTER